MYPIDIDFSYELTGNKTLDVTCLMDRIKEKEIMHVNITCLILPDAQEFTDLLDKDIQVWMGKSHVIYYQLKYYQYVIDSYRKFLSSKR